MKIKHILSGIFAVGLFPVIASAAFMTQPVQQRFEQARHDVADYTSKRSANSMGIRLELWKRTLPIIASAPLFGHGIGQWQAEYGKQTRELPGFSGFMMGRLSRTIAWQVVRATDNTGSGIGPSD